MKVTFSQEDLEERTKYLGEGEHEVAITAIEYTHSQKGNAMAWITFADKTGASFNDRFMLEGRGLFMLAHLARAAGFDLKAGQFDTEELKGRKLKAVRKITGKESRNDKEYNVYENTYSKLEFTDEQLPL